MKRKSALIARMFFMTILLFTLVTSCSTQGQQYLLQKEYLINNDDISPYLVFDPDECEWHTGQGRLYDYGLRGNYEAKGNTFICTGVYWHLVLELELIGEDKIRVVSIEDTDGVLDWLHEWGVLTHYPDSPY